jgi:hypothetical protein
VGLERCCGKYGMLLIARSLVASEESQRRSRSVARVVVRYISQRECENNQMCKGNQCLRSCSGEDATMEFGVMKLKGSSRNISSFPPTEEGKVTNKHSQSGAQRADSKPLPFHYLPITLRCAIILLTNAVNDYVVAQSCF